MDSVLSRLKPCVRLIYTELSYSFTPIHDEFFDANSWLRSTLNEWFTLLGTPQTVP